MPITKTAKRALRGSKRKKVVNDATISKMEIAIRFAKKSGKKNDVVSAISLIDRAVKKNLFHKNKAARMKSALSTMKGINTEKQGTDKKKNKKTSKK